MRWFSPFPYFGGKFWLLNELYNNIVPKIEHNTFVDVFGGSGKVVINYAKVLQRPKNRNKKIELVYNDKDISLYAVFYSVKNKFSELNETLKERLKDVFDRGGGVKIIQKWREQIKNNEINDLVELGAKTIILYHSLYGGEFGNTIILNKKSILRLLTGRTEYLRKFYELAKDIKIYNKDYREIIKMYNRKDVLLFVDPPYLNFEKYYRCFENRLAITSLEFIENNFTGSVIYTHNKDNEIEKILRKYNYEIKTMKRVSQVMDPENKEKKEEIIAIRKTRIVKKQKKKDFLDLLFDVNINTHKNNVTILDLFK